MLTYFKAPFCHLNEQGRAPIVTALHWAMGFDIRKMIPLVLSMFLLAGASPKRAHIALEKTENL
jgi:hypothetical protein